MCRQLATFMTMLIFNLMFIIMMAATQYEANQVDRITVAFIETNNAEVARLLTLTSISKSWTPTPTPIHTLTATSTPCREAKITTAFIETNNAERLLTLEAEIARALTLTSISKSWTPTPSPIGAFAATSTLRGEAEITTAFIETNNAEVERALTLTSISKSWTPTPSPIGALAATPTPCRD